MTTFLSLLHLHNNNERGWETEFEGWTPTTVEKFPFTATSAGDFYVFHCLFQDKQSTAILINQNSLSRVVLESSRFANVDALGTTQGAALEAHNSACIVTKCCVEKCSCASSVISAIFAYIEAPANTDKVIFRENTISNSGYSEMYFDYSGCANYIQKGTATISNLNVSKANVKRVSGLYFLGTSDQKGTISQCEFVDTVSSDSSNGYTVFLGNQNRNFEITNCNFLRQDVGYVLRLYGVSFVINGCSFIKGTSDFIVRTNSPTVSITGSYIDPLFTIPDWASSIITDSQSQFTNIIPTFNMNACIETPSLLITFQKNNPYFFENVPKKYQILFRFH